LWRKNNFKLFDCVLFLVIIGRATLRRQFLRNVEINRAKMRIYLYFVERSMDSEWKPGKIGYFSYFIFYIKNII